MKLFTKDDSRAISPVIGVVLILGITIGLGAIVGTAALGTSMGLSDSTPNAEFQTQATSNGTIIITHMSGESVDPNRIAVNEYPGEDVFKDENGNTYEKVQAGDTGEIPGSDTTSVQIQWESKNGDSTQSVYSQDLTTEQLETLNSSDTTNTDSVDGETTSEPTPEETIVLEDGFESGTYTNNFVDISQSSYSPQVTDTRANTGTYSLDLESSPGGSTSNRVKTAETYSNLSTVNASLNKYNDGGGQNIWAIRVWSAEHDGFIEVRGSGYHGGVEFREFDEDRNKITQTDMAGEFPQNEWKDVSLSIESGNVTVNADGKTETFETKLDWTQQKSDVRFITNGWGSGDNIDVAYDDIVIKEHVE